MSERIPVTIWGATGFAGAELLRISRVIRISRS